MSSEPKTFHEKVLAVQKAAHALNLTPEATGQVQSREYKYLTIQKLHAAVMPLLYAEGLTWETYPGEGPTLAYRLTDGENVLGGTMPLVGCDTMQYLGSAITYARRYALLAILGLTPDEDTDGATGRAENKSVSRSAVPTIPIDRAKKILDLAQKAGLAEGTDLKPALVAKLTEVGVETGRLGHLNVDTAEEVEAWIAKDAADAALAAQQADTEGKP